ncbi:hypothetical protein QBC39DRAFT_346810 [Podospora conica]|nr:hypothetical protein QBC39DRAFT_346810 [Schizothecium conicum]
MRDKAFLLSVCRAAAAVWGAAAQRLTRPGLCCSAGCCVARRSGLWDPRAATWLRPGVAATGDLAVVSVLF